MIDIHCHLLPGVDDGPETWEETIELLSILEKAGFTKIVATPHSWGASFYHGKIELLVKKTMEMLSALKIEMSVFRGTEIYFEDSAVFEETFHSCLSLASSKFLLVEFGFLNAVQRYEEFRFSAETNGYGVIIAHPCRYTVLGMNKLENLVSHGSLIQVNLGSLSGKYGGAAQKKSKRILEAGICHFLATDSHGPNSFKNSLAAEIEEAKRILGEKAFNVLMSENPEKIFSGEKPSSIMPVEIRLKTKKTFFS
ncbi:hypothetical protein JXL83_08105 [candidate division WOR-3 bacterium]|nr:hypothetical protein [candidate division WOR-3 bacterium]